MNQAAARAFEQSFLSTSLGGQIRECGSYELAPLFLDLFARSQPVLEAGCGSGRWCGWLQRNGIAADGIDWSRALCERAAAELPGCRFHARDMANSGLPGGSYGGLMALGSLEHAVEGPQNALAEFHRLLRPGGVAVVSVPHGSLLRIACRVVSAPLEVAKANRLFRRVAGKPPLAANAQSRRAALRGTVRKWRPHLSLSREGWSFYEYEFNRRQFDVLIAEAGFEVLSRFAAFPEQGLLHSFGRLAGTWNAAESRVQLSAMGRLLRWVLPASQTGHMLCYVLRRWPLA